MNMDASNVNRGHSPPHASGPRRGFGPARVAIAAALAAIGMAVAGAVKAQDAASFPAKPIRLVTSSLPGGLNDIVARLMADRFASMAEMRGHQGIVDSKPGGSGVIAAMIVAKAPADGHTLLVADLTQTSINPALLESPPYQTLRDFSPVSLLGTTPFFLAVNTSMGISDLKGFLAHVRNHPGKVAYGTSGVGSIHHLAFATLAGRANLEMTHVPFKSSGQSTPAMIANDVQVLFTAYGAMAPHVRAGKAVLLAVASPQRAPQSPEVPSFAEAGVTGVNLLPAVGLLAPAGTPKAVVDSLAQLARQALNHPESLKRLESLGIDPVANSPEAYAAQLAADVAYFAEAVRLSGARQR